MRRASSGASSAGESRASFSRLSRRRDLSAVSAFFGIGGSGISDACRRMKKNLTYNETLDRTVREITGKLMSG